MAVAHEVAHEGDIAVRGGPRSSAQFRGKRRRHQLFDKRKVVDYRPVHHRESDQRADARIVIGLQRGIDSFAADCRSEREVVDDGSAAGAQAFNRADHRAQVDLARRQIHRNSGAHQVHPQLQRQIFSTAALEVFMRMLMAIDQPRH